MQMKIKHYLNREGKQCRYYSCHPLKGHKFG